MTLVEAIFSSIIDIISEFGMVFVQLFDNIVRIFVVETADEVQLTTVGVLSLCVFGIGLIWTGIRWLSRLIKLRG